MSPLQWVAIGFSTPIALILIYVIARVVSTAYFISKSEQERRKHHG